MSDYIEDDFLGLEKGNYSRFYLTYSTRRASQAPGKFDTFGTMQLPNGSILHSMSGFDTLVSPTHGLPDPKIPLIINEKFPIYLKMETRVSDESSLPLGVNDAYIFRPNVLAASMSHFYQEHRKFHRLLSDRLMASMQGALIWADYSALNEMRVNGTLHVYRKFDIIFRSILNNIVRIGNGKHHYILLPQSNHVFSKPILQRTFKELSVSTLGNLSKDPSIFPIIHLLGMVFGKTRDMKVTPYKEDVKLLGKTSPILAALKSTSLLDRLDPSIIGSINFILTHEDRAVVYNLADIYNFADDVSFYTKFFRHVMNLRMSSSFIPPHVDPDSDSFDELVDTLSEDQTSQEEAETASEKPSSEPVVTNKVVVPTRSNEPLTPITKVEKIVEEPTPKVSSFEHQIRNAVKETAEKTSLGIPDVKEETKRNKLLDNHFKATIAGKTVGELVQAPPAQVVKPKQMDFITAAPEESYKTSSLQAMDKAYLDHAYHHELAKVVSSLGKHGMFISKIEEEHVHTEMDRTVTYKVALSDMNGKAHNVRFTVPHVDENGLMKLGGIEYRQTRQIANIPICKISPTRVNLSSYYNKIIIERVQSKRNCYENEIAQLILTLKKEGVIEVTAGTAVLPTKPTPYDYSSIGRNFTEIGFLGYVFEFSGNSAPLDSLSADDKDKVSELEHKFGTYAGYNKLHKSWLFWDKSNQIHEVNGAGESVASWRSFNHLLEDKLGSVAIPKKPISEWTQAKIINQKIPLIFILGYKFGVKDIFDKIKLDYRFYPKGTKPVLEPMDIPVKFADGVLVFNRYPVVRSLIASGLSWVNLSDVNFRDLSIPDTYVKIFEKKDMRVGVLKGLSGFFDFFVDPITETVLEKMHEPTTFHELLLRANVMLSDYVSDEATSVSLHRFRLYERFNGIVYNEIYRALANHRNNPSSRKGFSINPEAVFQKIVQDTTISPNDVINPVHEVKQKANFTFTGSGGRTPNSFVLKDRIYPKDGLGVISDAVPDSGKVGITAYLSASPNIDDIHGIPKPYKEGDTLEPPQILSIGSMVMPGGTTDDGKRNAYLSIQISHYVPNVEEGETLSVRTGYDEVLPHLNSDTFAVAAVDDGVVESIDTKHQVLTVRYKDKPVHVLRAQKLPYLDNVLNEYRQSHKTFGFLIPESQISDYPIGGIFSVTKSTNARIVDRLRCDTVESIPDKDIVKKQNTLIADFVRGKYKALYYIRFSPMGTKTPGDIKSYSYKDIHSPVSGAYLLQKRVPNVKEGETFKTGDILVYNPGFYVPNPLNKQVTFKHGVIGTVALIEKSSNHEDACEITKDFAEKLKMTPCHQREIVTTKDAAVLTIVKVGDHVETSDSLCIISDEYLVQSSLTQDVENIDIMEKLNRQTPPADYTGTIKKIRILYGCERDELSDSLKAILKTYEKDVLDNFKALNTDPSIRPPERPGWVKPGTKYKGVDIANDTVILEFMIEKTIGVSEGDKLCFSNAAKSIVSYVSDKPHYTESGIPVDTLFSTTSIMARIINSPFFVGVSERNLEELKKQAVAMYFDN